MPHRRRWRRTSSPPPPPSRLRTPHGQPEPNDNQSRETIMDIHEYQAKELLSKFGVPIPRGGLAYSPEHATSRATEIGGSKWVVKAQIHSGARGKAGGIKVCSTDTEIERAAEDLLGKKLVTHQTGPSGKLVSRLYIEEAS